MYSLGLDQITHTGVASFLGTSLSCYFPLSMSLTLVCESLFMAQGDFHEFLVRNLQEEIHNSR